MLHALLLTAAIVVVVAVPQEDRGPDPSKVRFNNSVLVCSSIYSGSYLSVLTTDDRGILAACHDVPRLA